MNDALSSTRWIAASTSDLIERYCACRSRNGITTALQQLGAGEEERDLDRGRLGRIRAVYRIALDVGRKLFADRALGRVDRVGRAHRLAPLLDRVRRFQRHHD